MDKTVRERETKYTDGKHTLLLETHFSHRPVQNLIAEYLEEQMRQSEMVATDAEERHE